MKPSARELVPLLSRRLREEPENLGLRVMLAGSLLEIGRTPEAVDLYRSVAMAYRDQGRMQQAIAVCRSILEIAPDDATSRALHDSLAPPIPAPPTLPATKPTLPRRATTGHPDETPLPKALPHHVADPTTSSIPKLDPPADPQTERVELTYPVDSDTEDETSPHGVPQLPPAPPAAPSPRPSSSKATKTLLASAFFAPIPTERRAAILAKMVRRSFAPASPLVSYGETTHPLVLVVDGELEVRVQHPGKPLVVLDTIRAGDYIGERSLLAKVPSVVDVVAVGAVEVMLLLPRDFYDVAAAFPALWAQLKEVSARRTRDYDAKLSAS